MRLGGVAGVAYPAQKPALLYPFALLRRDAALFQVRQFHVDVLFGAAHHHVVARKVFSIGLRRTQVRAAVHGFCHLTRAGTVDLFSENRVARGVRRVDPDNARPRRIEFHNVQREALCWDHVVVVEQGAVSSLSDVRNASLERKREFRCPEVVVAEALRGQDGDPPEEERKKSVGYQRGPAAQRARRAPPGDLFVATESPAEGHVLCAHRKATSRAARR